LDPDTALAAVTTVPARLLGIDGQTGRIAPGMLANLVIADGEWFAKQTKILECWVAGEQFVTTAPPLPAVAQLAGRWLFELPVDGAKPSLQLELIEKDGKLSGTLGDASEPEADASPDKAAKKPAELRNVASERDRTTATIDLHAIDPQLPAGVAQLTLILLAGEQPEAGIVASIVLPDGQTVPLALRRAAAEAAPQTQEPGKGAPAEADDVTAPAAEAEAAEAVAAEVKTPAWFPLGAYGLEQRITEQPTVMFRGATVWTCDPSGVLESADVLIRDGLIAAVGPGLAVPAGCQIIDARGKHITPGLIDCHSHMGTDGGINESGQPVTAEVRIGDFIDNSDIQIYRQAAGGLTVANLLHGSANPIGGQNQVIKLRWGETMDGLRMREAPAGIKFALGENVKRNQARYPSTRMGVQQIIRDQLLAAREYQARWRDYRQGHSDGLPPRVDLQLEALAEVQRGQRWIHCHSYRQDEIVATLDLLEEFGITIGTLQHILEGYKVADRMARHGAMGSSFSDWWAYKFEVFDAIPYNGALMHDLGVVVSFNSDDRELARHLNTEAAKATKYGGVPEHEALQMVTLNPARQLRIDPYVGSLTVGKHADLVVWSGRPLSTLSRCEQTWIDGRRYFDLDSDQQLRQRDAELRARLIQKALATDAPDEKPGSKKVEEEERWVRHDIYCAAHGAARHDQGGQR
jgi:N-acetylglucosamine-6-phosphate deacetylase